MGVLGAVGAAIGDALLHPGSAGGNNVTFDDLISLVELVKFDNQLIGDVFTSADEQTKKALAQASDAGGDIITIANDLKLITQHTYDTVIPESLSWLRGNIVTTLIDPLRLRIAQLQHDINFLMGWRGQVDNWRNNWVDPNIGAWRAFHTFFDTWPLDILNTWHTWLAQPHLFAEWATPPLIGPIIGYLADESHKTSRDNLNAIMVRAWVEEPELVWTAVQHWLIGR